MTYLCVIPYNFRPYWTECLATLKLDSVLHIDNTVNNRGVAGSWNIGAKEVLSRELDWLIVCSASMRFGPPGGQDFVDLLADHPDHLVVEAEYGIGWHFAAFNRRVFERVGLFDENFHPAYFEDLDMSFRIQIGFGYHAAFKDWPWTKIHVDAECASAAHGILLGHAVIEFEALKDYYVRKWGGVSGAEKFRTPFNLPNAPLGWSPRSRENGIQEWLAQSRGLIAAKAVEQQGPPPAPGRVPRQGPRIKPYVGR